MNHTLMRLLECLFALALAAILFFVLAAGPVKAADVTVTHAFASYHDCRSCGYNEFNPGVGLEVPVSDRWYIGGGIYENSMSDRDTGRVTERTKYLGVGYEYRVARYLTIGAEGGRLWGYREFKWMAAPTVSIGTDRLNIKAIIVPTVVTGFQLRVGFDL